MAREVIDWAAKNLNTLSVHFCSARYKDAVQLRNRLARRLAHTIRDFELQAEDDSLLVLGVIRAIHGMSLTEVQLQKIYHTLHKKFEVPIDMMNIDTIRMRIEIAPWILEDISSELKDISHDMGLIEIGIVYEYPSWDRMQTMFEPV